MTIHYPTLGFIGAGNMTRCLISGLIANEYPAKNIWASNPSSEKLDYLQHQFGIHVSTDNSVVAKEAAILILAVKPQILPTVAKELAEVIHDHHPLIVSIAAGVTIERLQSSLGSDAAIVRCMPNIPAFVGSGATGMFANAHVSHLHRDLAESILRAVGITLWVEDEKLMDVIAALSGSGPAYFFLVMEALENVAMDLGLNRDDAHLLTLQTALGAARLAMSTNETPLELRERVTSKGGITEKAINLLESRNVQEAFANALRAAHNRSIEMAKL